MNAVLGHYAKVAEKTGATSRVDSYRKLLLMLRSSRPDHQPDWDEVATRWLELIRPVWYEQLKAKRTKPLVLRDIRRNLFARETELGPTCIARFHSFPVVAPPDDRIRACIVGVAVR